MLLADAPWCLVTCDEKDDNMLYDAVQLKNEQPINDPSQMCVFKCFTISLTLLHSLPHNETLH